MEQILLLSLITQYFFVLFLIIQNENCGTVYANSYDNISICETDYIHRVRLINPTGIHEDIPVGRLEIFHDGIWGTVCHGIGSYKNKHFKTWTKAVAHFIYLIQRL